MGQHFVFRIQGTKYEGMRMASGLYSAVVATVNQYGEKDLPCLLADNTFKQRTIRANHVDGLRDDFFYAGQIILSNPLVNYDMACGEEVIALEETYTPTQLAVNLATAIELCDQAKSQQKGISIKIENGNPDHARLSFEQELRKRVINWLYLPDAADVLDHKLRFKV